MYIPSGVILLVFFAMVAGFLSGLARMLKIPLLKYWVVPMTTVLPWNAVMYLVFALALIAGDASRSQAMGMSAMYPFLGMFAGFGLGSLISFFIPSQVPLKKRALWSLGISLIPAIIVAGLLVYALFN